MPQCVRIRTFERTHRRAAMACDGPREGSGAPKRFKLGLRRCGTQLGLRRWGCSRCVGPWGYATAQGGSFAHSPVAHVHISLSIPPRDGRARRFSPFFSEILQDPATRVTLRRISVDVPFFGKNDPVCRANFLLDSSGMNFGRRMSRWGFIAPGGSTPQGRQARAYNGQ